MENNCNVLHRNSQTVYTRGETEMDMFNIRHPYLKILKTLTNTDQSLIGYFNL